MLTLLMLSLLFWNICCGIRLLVYICSLIIYLFYLFIFIYSGDYNTKSRLEKYLVSGEIMRKESLRNSSVPCLPLESDLEEGEIYCVESTGAIVTLSSSIGLIYFYCSRLPSDGLVLFSVSVCSMLVYYFIHSLSWFYF